MDRMPGRKYAALTTALQPAMFLATCVSMLVPPFHGCFRSSLHSYTNSIKNDGITSIACIRNQWAIILNEAAVKIAFFFWSAADGHRLLVHALL